MRITESSARLSIIGQIKKAESKQHHQLANGLKVLFYFMKNTDLPEELVTNPTFRMRHSHVMIFAGNKHQTVFCGSNILEGK